MTSLVASLPNGSEDDLDRLDPKHRVDQEIKEARERVEDQ